jgi:amphi-Trp domain-containing protein
VTPTIPAAFRGRARRDAAAFYLTQLAKGVLDGELGVISGHGQTALVTSEFLILEIAVKQKKRANHVEIKLRWPKRPLIRLAVRGVGRSARHGGLDEAGAEEKSANGDA